MVTKAPIFASYKQQLKTIVKTDFSDYISSRVFFQLDSNKLLDLNILLSKKLNPIECNYEIYDKELMF